MNIKQIKLKSNKSDKYSIQIYRFMKKYGVCKIYWYKDNKEDSYRNSEFNGEFKSNQIFVATTNIEERVGTFFNSIVTSHSTYKNTGCYMVPLENFTDITEEFWSAYIKKGRCIYGSHTQYLLDDGDRFTYINKNSRRCNWCGKWERRTVKTIKSKRTNKWVSDRVTSWD